MTALSFVKAAPVPITFGGVRVPQTGGSAFRVDRRGDRWAFDFTTSRMPIEPEGGLLEALFDEAQRAGGLFRVRIPGFDPGAPGAPTIGADTVSGRVLPLVGLSPNYVVRPRQWLSVIVDGQRYLDRVTHQAIADSSGAANVTIRNLIRVPLSADDLVELDAPKIQGTVAMRQAPDWGEDRMMQFAFTVTEDA